jgi:hypothetical protein
MAAVIGLQEEFAAADGYFYYLPPGRILCGFVYEQLRGRAYIWQYTLPLFERLALPNLNFGDRLPQPAGIMSGFETAQDAAIEFLRRIKPFEMNVRALQDPLAFLGRFEFTRAIENPRVRRTIGLTHIVAGNSEQARAHLEKVLSGDPAQLDFQFFEDIRCILADLNSGLDKAQHTLLTWESETKRRFNIVSDM